MIVAVVAVVFVVLALWAVVLRLRIWIGSGPPRSASADEEEESNDPLVASIRTLATRVTLNEDFYRTIKKVIAMMIVGGIVFAGLVGAVAVLAVKDNQLTHRLRASTDTVAAVVAQETKDRAENTIGACVQFNVQQAKNRSAIADGLVNAFKPLVTSASGQAGLDTLSTNLHAQVDALLPFRDCSPTGIDEFLKNPPPDPNTGH